jgi:hypothetical protein
MIGRYAKLFTLLGALLIAGSSAVSAATVIPWEGSEANRASYWDAYFGRPGACTKVDKGGAFTTRERHDAIVIKNDQRNFVYQPAPAGAYTTDKGVSHWFYCDWDEPPKCGEVTADGYVCGDPRSVVTISNTTRKAQTVTLRFVSGNRALGFPVRKVDIVVQPGQDRVIKRWVKGGTVTWVEYEGERLFQTAVTRSTNIGPCPKVALS